VFGRVFLILLLLAVSAGAGTISPKLINIQAGINVFNDPRAGTASYVEFPFSLKRSQFEFSPMDGESWLRGEISADLYLFDTLGNRIDSASTYFYTRAGDMQKAAREDIELYNKLTLYIEPGIYEAMLRVTDVIGGKTGTYLFGQFEIAPLICDSLSMSNIELAQKIRIVDDSAALASSRLIKNGYEIIPSPMGIFNKIDNDLYIYAELYNLQFSPGRNDSFMLACQIYKENGEPYFDFGEMAIIKPGSTAVITNRIDYSSWAVGKYELKLTATDLSTGAKAESRNKFAIASITRKKPSDYSLSSYRSPLDTASMATKTHWIRFIVSSSDWEMFESLNDAGKDAFIDRYFADRDPSPKTKINEYLLDVISRFNYANDNFSSLAGTRNGWNTDRGRILLKYGLSDEIKEASPPSVTKPIQVWYYYSIQGGVYFVFEDTRGYGNYRLVHSTAKGEIYSGGWDEIINNYELDFN